MSKRQNKILKDFFGKKWRNDFRRFKHSGFNLAKIINAQEPKNVLDLGCGRNLLKDRIKNLVGIDIVNESADLVCDIMELELEDDSDAFDIVLALGSINFGREKDILAMLKRVNELMVPSGKLYMRVNPGIRHKNCKDLIIFPWTLDNIDPIGKKTGFTRISPIQKEARNRWFFVYMKQ